MKLKFLWSVGFKDNVAKNVKNGWDSVTLWGVNLKSAKLEMSPT